MKTLLVKMKLLSVAGSALLAQAQVRDARYPAMAPIDQYLMAPEAEIALARSAAPESVSRDADVVVLGRQGYRTAVKGKNGFVCIVERSWAAGIDDPEFWNPKMRAPICLNAAAARSYLRLIMRKTEWVVAGVPKARVLDNITAAFDRKELPEMEPGAMGYMMSKQGYLNDGAGHWHPHVMFYVPLKEATTWGANLPGSPIIETKDAPCHMTVFVIPVGKWSDGTAGPAMEKK